ncbi:MAG: 50S ribosomal protein L25/general stress protein Ctc [Gammaproteobacteria bacterium]|nr:50S ribosomal protein L25/general stress protein Ctc [Gammaproteobacteria bacterium]
MSTNFVLEAQSRDDVGKGASRRLRHANKVPAVMYGGGVDPVSLTLNHDDVIKSLENEAFYASVLTIKIDGKPTKAVLKDVQRHAFKPKALHLDLQRVNEKEKLHMHVPLHFTGEESAIGVKEGGLISHNMSDLEIICLAKDLPEFIEVDVSGLSLEQTLHISDLKLPSGVESVQLSHGADHDLPVVSIHKKKGSDDAAASGEGAAATEEGGE